MTRTILPLLTLLLALPALAQPDERSRREIPALTVSGSGQAEADPDQATVRLGITRQADRARAAQEAVNATAQKILAALARQGIEAKQIQTAQLTLFPLFAPQKPGEDSQPRIVGYRASNVVSVRVEQLEKVGPVIDAGLEAGANQLEGVSFGLRNDLPAREQALREAVREARQKARTMAEALEVRLGEVLGVEEGGVSINQPVYADRVALRGEAATPVSPGQITVHASVTIRYRIVQ